MIYENSYCLAIKLLQKPTDTNCMTCLYNLVYNEKNYFLKAYACSANALIKII